MPEQEEGYEERIRASFAKQGLMGTLNAELVAVAPGRVEIAFSPPSSHLAAARLRSCRGGKRHC